MEHEMMNPNLTAASRSTLKRWLGVSFAGLAAVAAPAGLPQYGAPELLCRANFTGAYNMPNTTFFSNTTPVINANGDVAVRCDIVQGMDIDGIWFGSLKKPGQMVLLSAPEAVFSDVSLNDDGVLVTPQGFSLGQDGIYYYDTVSQSGGLLTTLPLGASSWGAVTINNSGDLGYRAAFSGRNSWVYYNAASGNAFVRATEATILPSSPYSFLFTPAFNDAGQIAGKVRLGPPNQVGESQPDQIVRIEPDGSVTILAHDVDSMPGSPFLRFDNSVDINASGHVVFQATLAGNVRGVFVTDGVNTIEIARTGKDDLTNLESFRPAMNDSGLVVFRGFMGSLRAVWLGDGESLTQVAVEHDLVETDLGLGRIDQHDTSPTFGGGPEINNAGDIVFHATLTPADNNQIEWGSGIFVRRAKSAALPGDMNCDGVITVSDIGPFVLALTDPAEYAAQFPDCNAANADINGDGTVTVSDIGPFVALLTQ
jgi:hypothetical protein